MVVAQLVEWSLPAPEVRGLNPIIDIGRYSTKCNLEMSKMKEIEVGEAHLKKTKSGFSRTKFRTTRVRQLWTKISICLKNLLRRGEKKFQDRFEARQGSSLFRWRKILQAAAVKCRNNKIKLILSCSRQNFSFLWENDLQLSLILVHIIHFNLTNVILLELSAQGLFRGTAPFNACSSRRGPNFPSHLKHNWPMSEEKTDGYHYH